MWQIYDPWAWWCAIISVSSVGWTVICVRLWRRFLRGRHFPDVHGTVLSRQVVCNTDGEGGVSYSMELSFTYTVAGRGYTSSRYHSLGHWGGSRKYAERASQKFEAGRPVRVFYDPTDPGFAFVKNGPLANIYLPMAGILCFWVVTWFPYRHTH